MEGYIWGITFLETSTRISGKARKGLLISATRMFYEDENERRVKCDEFEGVLVNTRKYGLVGEYGGIRFRAEIETDSGKETLSFLVSEQGRGNSAFTIDSRLN